MEKTDMRGNANLVDITSDEKDEATELAMLLYEHIEGQIISADSKASFMLVANSLLGSAIAISGRGIGAGLLDENTPWVVWLLGPLYLAMFGAFLLSVFAAISVTMPRTSVSKVRSNLYFFGYIAECNEDKFVNEFLGQIVAGGRHSLLASVHAKACIAQRKFERVRDSQRSFVAALSLWAIVEFIHTFIIAN